MRSRAFPARYVRLFSEQKFQIWTILRASSLQMSEIVLI